MSESLPGQGETGSSTTTTDKDSSVECPTCGRTDFTNEYGLKQHHAKVHGESLTTTHVECSICGEELERRKEVVEEQDDFYCSEGHGKVETKCDYCGSTVKKWPHELEESENVFCAKECHGNWRSENIVGEKHPNYRSEVVSCSNCGSDIEREKWHAESREHHFCDKECHGDWLSDNVTGEKHQNWNGGYEPYYGPDWYKQREKARERDNYTCQVCGTHQSELDRALDVHHMIRKDDFDSLGEANKLDNLVSLCRSCHGEWEGIPLRPQRE